MSGMRRRDVRQRCSAARRLRDRSRRRSLQYAVEFLKRGKGMPRIVQIAIKVDDLE